MTYFIKFPLNTIIQLGYSLCAEMKNKLDLLNKENLNKIRIHLIHSLEPLISDLNRKNLTVKLFNYIKILSLKLHKITSEQYDFNKTLMDVFSLISSFRAANYMSFSTSEYIKEMILKNKALLNVESYNEALRILNK